MDPHSIVQALVARQIGVAFDRVDARVLGTATRILASRLSSSVVENEEHTTDRARRKLLRADPSNTRALQFSKLHKQLSQRVMAADRQAILAFLLAVSEQGPLTAPSVAIQSAFAETGLRHVADPAPFVRSSPYASNTSTPVRRPLASAAAAPVTPLSSSSAAVLPAYARYASDNIQQVPEQALLRDLLFVFQGIDGRFIRWEQKSESFSIDPQANLSGGTRALVQSLCEVGWLHRRITEMLGKRRSDATFGLIGQSFLAAMTEELAEYQRLVVVLESQLIAPDKEQANAGGVAGLTLKRLLVWMVDPMERLKMLAIMAECCQEHKGGALISSVYRYTRHGDPSIAPLVQRLLEKICAPFFDMLVRWIEEGVLVDPLGEFMVTLSSGISVDADPWARKYALRATMVPAFLPPALSNKILLIGKSINFIRDVCRDTRWSLPMSVNRDELAYASVAKLEATVDAASAACSQHLRDLLFNKFALMEHLRGLRSYLLLRQGDFVQVLMDQLAEDLDQPASKLAAHHPIEKLETAVRFSNAQHDNPDVLKRLTARVLRASPGEVGWNVFTLDYHLDPPLSSVISEGTKQMYLRLFSFLWRLRRTQHALDMAYREQLGYGTTAHSIREMRLELHHGHILREQMLHFISQMQYYVVFEVLECSWDDLCAAIKKESALDDVIGAHERYVNDIASKVLLNESSQRLFETLLKLFDIIIRFQTAQSGLYRVVETELRRRQSLEDQVDSRTKAGKWGLTTKDRAETLPPEVAQGPLRDARRKLGEVNQAFEATLGEFLAGLGAQSEEALRSLRARLDFNEFYLARQK